MCRHSNGHIIKAISQISPPCDPNFGEVLAALLAVSLAAFLKLKNFTLEGESLVVIMALQHPSIVQYWQIEKVIVDSISLIIAFSIWPARKIHISANFYTLI